MQKTDREAILKTFLRIIDHISNREYQIKAWIKGEGVDFGEIVNLFSDLGDLVIENYKEFEITEKQYNLLKNFRLEFKIFYDENESPEEFINTPDWKRIMKMATDILEAFKYKNM